MNNICSCWHYHHSSELWHCNSSSGFVLWLLLAPPSSYSHRFTVPPNTFPVLLADCCFWSYVLMSTPPARASTQPSIEPSSICSIYTHRYLVLGCTYLLCTLYRNSTYPTIASALNCNQGKLSTMFLSCTIRYFFSTLFHQEMDQYTGFIFFMKTCFMLRRNKQLVHINFYRYLKNFWAT